MQLEKKKKKKRVMWYLSLENFDNKLLVWMKYDKDKIVNVNTHEYSIMKRCSK